MTKSTPKPQSFPFTVLAAVIIVGGSIGYFGAQKFGSRYFFGLGAALATTGAVIQSSTNKTLATRKKPQH
ncbi:hypothetical protein HUN01_28630 [Nostoc edaphicum CCNP1411]|uniref:Uncharacterized protein n=1 Tax=Nostoc edaphicum CCNP1411 TaxID=1472755 RepID=A0A7D7LI48_9NOSO|nr:hypothetical protein [Nostoc edaphicum]QMS91371.1 hypothetical protein HUN01_28630 [Nostoc edaphicum CCNP1411]